MLNEDAVTIIKGKMAAGEDYNTELLALYEQNRPLLEKVARRYTRRLEFEDLEQEGFLALIKAVENYDPTAGASFSSYWVMWLRASFYGLVASQQGIPRHIFSLLYKYRQVRERYQTEQGREPTDLEYVHGMEFDRLDEGLRKLEQVRIYLKADYIDSLDVPIGEEMDITRAEQIASTEDIEEEITNKVLHEELQEVIWQTVADTLTEQQADIITRHYRSGEALKDIAQAHGVSASYVTSERQRAIEKLRRKKKLLRPFMDAYGRHRAYDLGIRKFTVQRCIRDNTSSTESAALKMIDEEARRTRQCFEAVNYIKSQLAGMDPESDEYKQRYKELAIKFYRQIYA